jgi:nucleoside 2-deoxyribosyltransferase
MSNRNTEATIKHESPAFAKHLLYEVPTYLAECQIGTLNRKTKRKKAMAKNVFIICTIRSATQEYLDKLENYVSDLESSGIKVYAPHRDTNQMALGYEICKQNMQGIIDADEVHIFYNSKSQGTHFDMGMAFALSKNIVVVENEELTEGKSFQRMLVEWQQSA